MPKLWNETIETHRAAVREAILDTTAALVAEHGLLSVTMSQIAEEVGIGRATLYKYFPDVEAILFAWHERGVGRHLQQLAEIRDEADGEFARLEAVLVAYALIDHEHHGPEEHHGHLQDRLLASVLHAGGHVTRAQDELHSMIRTLITEAARAGEARQDVAADELASYCLHALQAASVMPSKASVRRLVEVTLSGLKAVGA